MSTVEQPTLPGGGTVTRPPCPRCGHTHSLYTATSAVGRFTPTPRYRARHDGAPLRDTRQEAHRDACDHNQQANP